MKHTSTRKSSLTSTRLLASDKNGSVLSSQGRTSLESSAYTAYGHDAATDAQTLLGFNGERRNRMPALYLLGNGYRAYSTVLGRFTSPDSWSPFGDGGINSYCYCSGDPVNFIDPSGHGLTYADGRFFVFKKNTVRQVQVRPLHDAGLSQRAAIFRTTWATSQTAQAYGGYSRTASQHRFAG